MVGWEGPCILATVDVGFMYSYTYYIIVSLLGSAKQVDIKMVQ